MKKKVLSLFLALVTCLSLMPMAAFAATNDYTVTEAVPFKYARVRDFHEGFAAVATGKYKYDDYYYLPNARWGFVDTTGKEVVPCQYTGVSDFNHGFAAVAFNGMWGVVDTTGREVVPCKYNEISTILYGDPNDETPFDSVSIEWTGFQDGFAVVRIDYKYGIVNTSGEEIAPCKYRSVSNFAEGFAAVELDNKWGFIDTTGKEVVPCKYDRVSSFSGGFAVASLNGRAVIISTTGKEVVSSEYKIKDWFEGFVAVSDKSGKCGLINTAGKEIVPCKYDAVVSIDQGFVVVHDNKKYGIINVTGKEIVPCQYDTVEKFNQGFAAVKRDGKWGFIDATGKEVTPCKYDKLRYSTQQETTHKGIVSHFNKGYALAQLNGRWGIIDVAGKEVVPCKYEAVSEFVNGFAKVQQYGGKYGFVDTTGQEVVPCTLELDNYSTVGGLSEGRIMVSVHKGYNTYYGFIDTTGKEIIPCEYTDARSFNQGMAAVRGKDDKWGFIDTTGKEIVPIICSSDEFGYFRDGLARVCIDNKWGLMDATGKEVVPCEYALMGNFSEGFVRIFQGYQDPKWGFLAVTKNSTPATNPTPTANTAYASTQTVNVDGKPVTFECYALKDENGNPTNYIKLRDLAMLLNGSAAQFQVGWDGSVTITTKTAYTANGSELSTPYSGDRTYQESNAVTKVNGQVAKLSAFMLTDDQGGGYTYYQLRELGQALGFNVGWSADKGIFIETNKPYDPDN